MSRQHIPANTIQAILPREDSRMVSRLAAALALTLAGTGTAQATGGISNAFGSLYQGPPRFCTTCHVNTDTNTFATDSGGEITFGANPGRFYTDGAGRPRYSGTLVDRIVPRASNGANGSANEVILSALGAIEPDFTPRLTGDSAGIITLPGDATTVTFTFSVGASLDGVQPTMRQISPTSIPTGFSDAQSADTSLTMTISTASLPLVDRGNSRRAGALHDFSFLPINSDGMQPTTAVSLDLNRVGVQFANIAPTTAGFGIDASDPAQRSGNILTQGGADDPDSDGLPLRAILVPLSGPDLGRLVLSEDGAFNYTLPEETTAEERTTSFQYTVVDSEGLASAAATVTITIPGTPVVNPPPTAGADTFSTNEDTAPACTPLCNVLANDSDNDLLVVDTTPAVPPAHGTLALRADGTFSYQPEANFFGEDTFRYRVTGGPDTVTADVTITVAPINDAPTAVADVFSVPGVGSTSLDVLTQGVDTDVEMPVVLTVVPQAQPTLGSVVLAADGTITYTPPVPTSAVDRTTSFTYRAVDGEGLASAPATVSLTILRVDPVNLPPVAADDTFPALEDTPLTANVTGPDGGGADSDPDGLPAPSALTVSILQNPQRGTLSMAASGLFTYTPDPDANGPDTFTYQLSDGSLTDSASVTLAITPQRDPPVAVDDAFEVLADQAEVSGNLLTAGVDTDVDGPPPVAVVLADAPATGTLALNPDGRFTYTPALPRTTDGQVTFTYRAVDADGDQSLAPATVRIMVRAVPVVPQAPVAAPDALATPEDTELTGNVTADNGSGPDRDPNGDALSVSVLTAPRSGTLNLSPDGSFTYLPNPNVNGTDTFRYQLRDPGGLLASALVTLTITPQNDPPRADIIALSPINELQGAQALNLLNPTYVRDPDGDALVVSNVTVTLDAPLTPTPAFAFTLNGAVLQFDPAQLSALDDDEFATLTFRYDISDGTAPPVAGRLTLRVLGLDNGLGRAAGAYADTLTERYNNHFQSQNVAPDSCLSCHNVGQVDADVDSVNDCTPGVFNTYGLRLCLARNPGTPALTDLVRRLSLIEGEFAPQLNTTPSIEIASTTAVNATIAAPLTATRGRTVDGAASEIVTYLLANGAAKGAVDTTGQFRIDAGGQLRVNSALAVGTYTVRVFPVNDAGQKDSVGNVRRGIAGFLPFDNPGAVTITVIDVIAEVRPDVASTAQGEAVLIDVLANDTAAAGTTVRLETAATNGTVIAEGATAFRYTPRPGFTGEDRFTYRAVNTAGVSLAATVTVIVASPGAPVARDDFAVTPVGRAISVAVLGNDTNALTGSAATVVSVTTPPLAEQGTATVSGQTVLFTPAADFVGEARFVYQALNPGVAGQNASQATVVVDVVRFGEGLLADATDDPELKKVASAFDQSCAIVTGLAATADTSAFLAACADLTTAAAANSDIDRALAALRNEEHLAAVDATATIARGLGGAIRSRIDRVRNGSPRGVDLHGVKVSIDGNAVPMDLVSRIAAGVLGMPAQATSGAEASRYGMFISGDLTFADRDAGATRDGYDLQAANLMIGIDRMQAPGRMIGASFGASSSETDFTDGGQLSARGYQLSLYGFSEDFLLPGLVLDGYASVGTMAYTSDRRINFTANGVTVDEVANARFDGHYINIAPRLSFSQVFGRYGDPLGAPATDLQLGWFAGFDYLKTFIDGYQETGGGGFALATQNADYSSLLATLGVEASRPVYPFAGVQMEVFGSLAANAELMDGQRSVLSSFVTAGPGAPTFLVTENGDKGLFGTLELGTIIAIRGGVADLRYSTDFGRDLRSQSLQFSYSQPILGNDSMTMSLGGSQAGRSGIAPEAGLEYQLKF